ncbi:FGGY family carbohydrate kinase [Thalassotalea sp. ND16A]|uniref:FGGY family carbohydrate kinase n=1 Tax=Thalassotalea sp. ND16A TaxID=1535422 RepID=UPI00051A717A|nr:FGGY family carbohydrate kinase [Thalassotalea sp. ND16A]KGJ95681.1 Glycerol kinase [Thalassotalea sp. ND16A]
MYFLSIDQGGSSTRALVCDGKGGIICQAQIGVNTRRKGVFVEQQPDEIWQSVKHCIQQCYQKLSATQQGQLVSAALVTQRSSFIAINTATNQPLTQVISWQDTRGQDYLEALEIDNAWLQKLTGLRASSHFGASKMLWCLKHEPAVQIAAKNNTLMFLPIASYLAHCLTGNMHYYVDPANASRTLLFAIENAGSAAHSDNLIVDSASSNTSDSENGNDNQPGLHWSEPLLELFAIKKHEILPTNSLFGQITVGKHVIPLRYVNGDQSSALFAYGMPGREQIYLNMGTGAFISRLSASRENTDKDLLHSIVSTEQCGDRYCHYFALEGTINGAGAALELMAKKLAVDIEKLNVLSTTEEIVPLFVNAIGGLAAPYWRSDIRSHFIGKSSKKAEMIAVVESIVFLAVTIIKRMSKGPADMTSLVITGGLAKHDDLCQLIADLSGLNILRKQQVEASALGAVWSLAGQPVDWLTELSTQQFIAHKNSALLHRFKLWTTAMDDLTTV